MTHPTSFTVEDAIAEYENIERRAHEGKLARIIAGLTGAADDLESDLSMGYELEVTIAARLRRIAGDLGDLTARDLLR